MIQIRKGVFETNSSSTDVYVIPLEYSIPSEVILGYDDDDHLSKWYSRLKYNNNEDKIESFFCWLRDCGVKKIYIRDKHINGEVSMDTLPIDKGEMPHLYWLSEDNYISKCDLPSMEEVVKSYFFGDSYILFDTSDEQTQTKVELYRKSPHYALYEV